MSADPLAAADGVPPRHIEPWTQVSGHAVVANRPQAFCACGERAPRDWKGTGREWREAHLREAWPILVPRQGDESYGSWLDRIALRHSEAVRAEDELYHQLGFDHPVEPGQPYPVITDEYAATGERVEVLKHQVDEVRAKTNERKGWSD